MIYVLSAVGFFALVGAAVGLLIALVKALTKQPAWPAARFGLISIAVLIVAAVATTAFPVPKVAVVATPTPVPKPTLPPYLALVAGQHAYVNSNSEGDNSKGTFFRDWATVTKWASGAASGPSELPHYDVPVGTEIVVQSWKTSTCNDDCVMVDVQTTVPPIREGYVLAIDLIPIIPVGTILIATAPGTPNASKTIGMGSAPGDSKTTSVRIGSHARLLDVVHDSRLAAPLADPFHVEILDGPQKGRRGYLGMLTASASSNGMGGEEYRKTCRCVTIYLNEHV